MQGVIHVAVKPTTLSLKWRDDHGQAVMSFIALLHALYSPSQLIYPVLVWRDEHGQAVMFLSLYIIHPCPDCVTPGRLYEPSSCQTCQTFLADMRQDPSPSSLARKTWVKWNRTLVNHWKKNKVALYSPSNVRMLLWADTTLFSYEAVLPPAPPARSASRESLLSAGRVCCRPGGQSPPRPFPAKTEAIRIAALRGRASKRPYHPTKRPRRWPPRFRQLNHRRRRRLGRLSYRPQPNHPPNRHWPCSYRWCQASGRRWRASEANWLGRSHQC